MVDEYIYCKPGTFDHMEGFEELKEDGVIVDCYVFRWKGAVFASVENSGDRIGGYTIQGDTMEELREKHNRVNRTVKVISASGADMMHHDMLEDFDAQEA